MTFIYKDLSFSEKLGGLMTGAPAHEKHRLTITAEKNGVRTRFVCSYQYNPTATRYNDGDGLRAVLMDAQCYNYNRDFDSFCAEFGFDKYAETNTGYKKNPDSLRAFKGCRRAFAFFQSLGLTADDVETMRDELEG